jgi:hypothetical protein
MSPLWNIQLKSKQSLTLLPRTDCGVSCACPSEEIISKKTKIIKEAVDVLNSHFINSD